MCLTHCKICGFNTSEEEALVKNTRVSLAALVKNTRVSLAALVKNTRVSLTGLVKNTRVSLAALVKNTKVSLTGMVKNTRVSLAALGPHTQTSRQYCISTTYNFTPTNALHFCQSIYLRILGLKVEVIMVLIITYYYLITIIKS